MKIYVVLLIVGISFPACGEGSLNHKQQSENDFLVAGSSTELNSCSEKNYRHKSEAELAAMSDSQLVDEDVKEQIYHMPALGDDYGFLIGKQIHQRGIKVLPILTEYIDKYYPQNASKCEEMRFFMAYRSADGFDNSIVRLRGIKEGQLAINALERAVERMRTAGFDEADDRHKSDFDSALLYLQGLKGINGRDEGIRHTLRVRHNVQLSDDELLAFSNYLVSLDPTYPTWSEVDKEGPTYLMKESKRYYEAYLKFMAKK
jgi:hypothetical protein